MSLFFVVLLLCCKTCSCAHLLITAVTASYGHWNPLLHIAKEALSRDDNFITFVIDENYDYYLNTITNDISYDENKYQIIYTPHQQPLDFNKFEDSMIQVHDGMIKHASVSFISKTIFLNHSQSIKTITNEMDEQLDSLMNHNLQTKHNNISKLRFDKVHLCLLDAFNFFDITLCNKMFNIPTIIHMFPAVISKAEYYSLRNTIIYLSDPFSLDFYSNMLNGTVMSYAQKWINLITNTVYIINQKLTSYYIIIPILHEFNAILYALNINKAFNINHYKNGFADFWDQTVIISSLSPPFTPVLYTRPRIKQFGFLLQTEDIQINDDDIWQWIQGDHDILFISMGSIHRLSEKQMQTMYKQLIKHSNDNKYRVLWALTHNIYANISNDELENDNFKIVESVQQLQVLKHRNIKLFLTHCGHGGIVEAIYTKTLMVLYPIVADQYMNGKRVEEIGVGILIRDRQNMLDLTTIIDTLLLNKVESEYYQYQLNKVHKMISYHGGIAEAMDFIEYAVEFGTQHLLCTYGHLYKCQDVMLPWYQQTMIDVYLIVVATVLLVTVLIKRCICDCLFNCMTTSNIKHKIE